MKKSYKSIFIGITVLFLSQMAMASNMYNTDPERDTVIIKFGNNSQIVLYIDDKNDLEELTRYDINKMLEELNLSVSNLNDSVQVLTIEDEKGDRYLKDTSIVYTTKTYQIEPDNYDSDDDDNYKRERYRYMPRSKFFFNIDIGLNNYLENGKTPDGGALYRLGPGSSWYWGLDPTMRSHIAGVFFIEWGAGLDFNVYRYQDNRTRLVADDTGVMFYKDTRDISAKKSKLATMYLQGKFVPMFALGSNRHRGQRLWNRVDKGFRIGGGAYAGYRLWSRTKFKYTENGSKRKDRSTSNFYINDLRYGIRGQIGYGGFDFFFMYDLNEMFQAGSGGPVLSRYQFGITL